MLRKWLTAVFLALAFPFYSHAVLVSVAGHGKADGLWDVSTIKGSYLELTATLQSQVWWEDQSLAFTFATLVGDDLGYPNLLQSDTFGRGPWFAADTSNDPGYALLAYRFYEANLQVSPSPSGLTLDAVRTFAIAERVSPAPEPATLVLVLVAAAGATSASRGLARRLCRSRGA